jgi:hypothetical protein
MILLAILSIARVSQARQTEPQHFVFKGEGAGRTGGHGAKEIEFHHYRSEDGVLVETEVERYGSPSEAGARLEALTGQASTVVKRGYKKAWDGRQVGRRVQLAVKGPDGKLLNLVAWADGSKVVVFRSKSLRHVIDFEAQVDPAVRPKDVTPAHH